ncbi:MAG: hypothetical protein JSW47_10965 [Phycisphaerales bacterium]|nr:MAG: hypothetical protein JSW47_10965 [Phycisphaerales bacterium]
MTKKRKAKKKRFRNEAESDEHLDRAYDAFDTILELVSEFCQKYLNDEYRQLCEDLTWAAYEEGLPLEKGKPAGWASGIVHALGFVNFLQDPSQSPHMTSAQLAEGFGISQHTMQAKSRTIRDELDLMQMDPDWCLPGLLKDNPLVWMLSVDGFLMDARTAPREVQEEAYRLGIIPYIPADEPERSTESNTKIIQFPSGQNKTSKAKSAQKQDNDEPTLFEGVEK